MCRFGVPKELVLDNGPQFNSAAFKEYCERLGTRLHFASAYHPQMNGTVERQNGNIFSSISQRLVMAKKGKWPKDLLSVLWSIRTTSSRATGFTPFKLLFGEEVVN